MINIKRYREWLIELKESINKAAEGARIERASAWPCTRDT